MSAPRANLVAPVQDTLTFEVLGWTPSTNGTVAAAAIEVTLRKGRRPPGAALPLRSQSLRRRRNGRPKKN